MQHDRDAVADQPGVEFDTVIPGTTREPAAPAGCSRATCADHPEASAAAARSRRGTSRLSGKPCSDCRRPRRFRAQNRRRARQRSPGAVSGLEEPHRTRQAEDGDRVIVRREPVAPSRDGSSGTSRACTARASPTMAVRWPLQTEHENTPCALRSAARRRTAVVGTGGHAGAPGRHGAPARARRGWRKGSPSHAPARCEEADAGGSVRASDAAGWRARSDLPVSPFP